MPLERDSLVIAGASSLLGAELKSLLEESRFAAWDFSLLDEETAAGTLTEASGEAAIIQPVEEGSFSRAKLIFFTGSEAFAQRNLPAARESGAIVIDLSGAALNVPGVQVGFAIDGPGNEELEAQTTQLLSFQSTGQPVFDAQVAFNLLDRYGAASREDLQSVRARIRREVSAAVGNSPVRPSLALPSPEPRLFCCCSQAAATSLPAAITSPAAATRCQKISTSLPCRPSKMPPTATASSKNSRPQPCTNFLPPHPIKSLPTPLPETPSCTAKC